MSTDTGNLINIEDFQKIQIRVGKVVSCEKVDWSNKLLKLKVSFGDFERNVFSGIAKYYSPEQLLNNKYLFVVNLEPRTIKEEVSEGMILASQDDTGKVSLVIPDQDIREGALVG